MQNDRLRAVFLFCALPTSGGNAREGQSIATWPWDDAYPSGEDRRIAEPAEFWRSSWMEQSIGF